jgi:hypothetical protein
MPRDHPENESHVAQALAQAQEGGAVGATGGGARVVAGGRAVAARAAAAAAAVPALALARGWRGALLRLTSRRTM